MKKFFSMLLLLCGFVTLSATLVVNAADPVATFNSEDVVNGSSYDKHTTADWILTCGGNSKSVGSNSGKVNLCKLGADYAYVGEPLSYNADTATTAAIISVQPFENIKEVQLTIVAVAGSGASTEVYLVSSAEANTGFAQVGVKGTCGANASITFEVNEANSKYYALVFHASAWFRLDSVVAKFMPNEAADINYYDVTYDTQGGSTIQAERVEENSLVTKPSDPKKSGHLFAGWYKEAECENEFDFATDVITGDTTIYAKWEVDPYTNTIYTHAIISTSNFNMIDSSKTSTYEKYNGTHEIGVSVSNSEKEDSLSFASNQVMPQSGLLQFKKAEGEFKNAVAISGHIKAITMDISEGEFNVSTSTSELNTDSDNVVTLSKTNNRLVVTNPEDAYFYIKVGADLGKVSSIDIAYEHVEKSTYTISFNEGRGTFVEGKGADIIAELGTTTTVKLPVAADMATRPYKYTVLSAWNDGTTSFKPGASVEVSGNKTFTAVYTAPANLTIAQAIEVAEIAGTTATTYTFSTKATIKEKSGNNVILTDSSTTETFVAYNPSNLSSLSVGDQVTVVGKIKTYNSVKEYDAPKVTVTKPAYATAFQAEETKASLKLDGDSISIRFGNMMTEASYKDSTSTQYGVVVSKNAADLSGLTTDTLEALINAGQGAECHAVKVNAQGEEDATGEYWQFALVLTDVPQAEWDAVLYATMYLVVNGNVYTAQVKEASVKSVAAAYLEGDTSNFSATTIDILNILAA